MCGDSASCPHHQAIALPAVGADYFTKMCVRLVGEGGLMSEQALQARLNRQGRPSNEVTAWLDQGVLRSIGWGTQRWLPMFQLSDEGCSLRPDVAAVAEELVGAMDDLEILAWFVCPNESLDRQTPLSSLRMRYRDVLEAARVDHFLASA